MGECCQEQRKAVRTREDGFDRMNVKDLFGTMQPGDPDDPGSAFLRPVTAYFL